MSRRNGNGALQGWNLPFTDSTAAGNTAKKSQLAETMGYATGDPAASYADGRLVNYEEIDTPITSLEGGTQASTGCNGLCTGFCTTTCSGTVTGATYCSDCTGLCLNSCSDGCTVTCGSGCINTCSGTCANAVSAS